MAEDAGKLNTEEEALALKIARKSLETAIREGRLAEEGELGVPPTGVFREKRAAFVTLHKGGMLRGCIGHAMPIEELWKSIRGNAVSAAIHDNRFSQVQPDELSQIALDVSVLTVPVDAPDYTHFKAGRHGIIMELMGRRSLFLPQVAPEQGWDEATTLAHLSMKAGLPPDSWQNPAARFKLFEAQVFTEPG